MDPPAPLIDLEELRRAVEVALAAARLTQESGRVVELGAAAQIRRGLCAVAAVDTLDGTQRELVKQAIKQLDRAWREALEVVAYVGPFAPGDPDAPRWDRPDYPHRRTGDGNTGGYVPAEAEIAAATREIREGWSPEEHRLRATWAEAGPWEVPTGHLDD